MRSLVLTAAVAAAILATTASAAPKAPPGFCGAAAPDALAFCVKVATKNPCLAHIIDHEDSTWEPTISYGGGHSVSASYGLAQADPGTKTAYYTYTVGRHHAGDLTTPDWATNRTTQLLWALNYGIGKYGSTCAAWQHWQYASSW